MKEKLNRRIQEGSFRQPIPKEQLQRSRSFFSDFSSNDYLGLAQDTGQQERVNKLYELWKRQGRSTLGASGSRLLSGDSLECRELEDWLAKIHNRPSATLFNSGYDANLSVLSCLLQPEDVVILDELCHNSLVMGVLMSRQREYKTFQHNNVLDLRMQLKTLVCKGRVLIVVESLYSMDGDIAPLRDILDLAKEYGSEVIVDEAHGLGLYGKTNTANLALVRIKPKTELCHINGGTGVLAALELESHRSLLCTIYTFGKAMGCHGAIVCGSTTLRDYLWNYARPFIYSTALPTHSLISIRSAYESMTGPEGKIRRNLVFSNVKLFRSQLLHALPSIGKVRLLFSQSPIQALVIPGNDECINFCRRMQQEYRIQLFPIRAPTVPKGEERVRIILHAHNTHKEVLMLTKILLLTLYSMGLLEYSSHSKL